MQIPEVIFAFSILKTRLASVRGFSATLKQAEKDLNDRKQENS